MTWSGRCVIWQRFPCWEQRLLLVLDFLQVAQVLSQPFRLDFEHSGGRAAHAPDFLAV